MVETEQVGLVWHTLTVHKEFGNTGCRGRGQGARQQCVGCCGNIVCPAGTLQHACCAWPVKLVAARLLCICVSDTTGHSMTLCLRPLLVTVTLSLASLVPALRAALQVCHSSKQWSGLLYKVFGLRLNNYFDTQQANFVFKVREFAPPASPVRSHQITP